MKQYVVKEYITFYVPTFQQKNIRTSMFVLGENIRTFLRTFDSEIPKSSENLRLIFLSYQNKCTYNNL